MRKFLHWIFNGGVTRHDVRDLLLIESLMQISARLILYPAENPVVPYEQLALAYLLVLPIGFLLGLYERYSNY